MELFGFTASGYEGMVVAIEVDIRRGIPGMDIVGLPGSAIREARDRIRVAIRNSGLTFPRDRILVNLAPADIPKVGTSYDLSIALAVLDASGQISPKMNSLKIMVLGELLLSGVVRPVPGVLPAVIAGLEEGIELFLVAEENRAEGCAVGKGTVYGIGSLKEAIHLLTLLGERKGVVQPSLQYNKKGKTYPDYEDLRGKALLKRAIEVSVTGRHSILLCGPPGGGKTMAAIRIPSIAPPLSREESLEVTRIHSLGGFLPSGSGLIDERPFRAPHHGASLEGILGGGRNLSVGEISLAHTGTLFLDEAPEFGRRILQALREPVEEGMVRLVRAGKRERFPADIHLVLAMNPCPCGSLGKERGVCLCSELEIDRYWRRLGGALLDRIDMRFPVSSIQDEPILNGDRGSREMKEEVQQATEYQLKRNSTLGVRFNNRLSLVQAQRVCRMEGETERFLLEVGRTLGLSGRGFVSVLRIARTIADLSLRDRIEKDDLLEAFQYRRYGEGSLYWPTSSGFLPG
ncbi:MAG: YifB family Mg chelatase-like AAA ATPase [Spirochaetes bacterium]|nr:YifB family Mg chelatase-like AAA ATPase [Spirochaetota bacterium]